MRTPSPRSWRRQRSRWGADRTDLQLDGLRAVVTGSSAGIGEQIARRLAAEGALVVVHGRRAAAVQAVAGYINGANLRIDGGSTAVI